MRWIVVCLGLWCASAGAEGIVAVLERSQQQRLAQRGAADAHGEDAARVRQSFERLVALIAEAGHHEPIHLHLVGGDLHAQAMQGRALAVSASVGSLPEAERLLLLAHELGHLALGHWQALTTLYLKHIPGEVTPATTEPVAAALGREAHHLAHQHELQADAFGYLLVRRLGIGVDDALALFIRQGLQGDSATHPGTRRRIAQLRALEAEIGSAPRQIAEAEEAMRLPPQPAR